MATNFEHIPDVLTISEFQKTLRIGRGTAYRLIKSKEIRSIRIGRSIRIPREYVMEFVNAQNIPIDDKTWRQKGAGVGSHGGQEN